MNSDEFVHIPIMTDDSIPEGGVIFIGDIAGYINDNKIESVDELLQLLKDRPKDADRLFGKRYYCPHCGDDRTGKGSLVIGSLDLAFCNETHYHKWFRNDKGE